MKTIQKLILPLLLLCQLLLGQSALADSLKPIDFIKDPSLLANQWQDDPIPLSSYTAEEKRLQRLINEKTATAIQTYSTAEQDKEWQQIDKDPITPTTWKILELDLTESHGKTYHTSLLRPNWWIRNIGADRNGNRFYLKTPEVVEGWAVVKEIRVNQLDTRLWDEARQGDFVYRPLTATFQHDSDTVQQLYFTGNDSPLEVTPEHPIYSIDRNDFVHAGSLRIGEQVKTRQGITTLEQRKQLSGTHRVYNLEVYRDHNFMVSMDSVLVHNTYVGGEIELPPVKSFEQGRNKALELIDDVAPIGQSKPIIGRLEISKGYGKVIGRQSNDGKVRWRLDYDKTKGLHFNVEDFRLGKGDKAKKYSISVEGGTEADYVRYLKQFNR